MLPTTSECVHCKMQRWPCGTCCNRAIGPAVSIHPFAATAKSAPATPAIRIISPKAGAAVSGSFNVVVEVSNFALSCPLFGKPDLAGYGHWHLNWDSTTGPMMGMMTMAGMSCRRTFRASTAGFKAGSTHTLIALLAGNSHAHLMPEVADRVQVTVR